MRRGAGLVLAVAALASCRARSCTRARAHRGAAEGRPLVAATAALRVPRTARPIRADGELDEPDWKTAARTGAFTEAPTGGPARPYSDARFLWDENNLYVVLYAADEDLRTGRSANTDAFSVRLQPAANPRVVYALDVSADGVLSESREDVGDGPRPWKSGAVVGLDRDGTLDDPSDDDEEWVVEAAIPLASLGLRGAPGQSIGVRLHRCDTPKSGERRCGAFGDGAARAPSAVLTLLP